MNQKQAFLAGNFIGLTGLLIAFLVVSPQKEKERQEYESKQKSEAAAQAPAAQSVVVAKRAIKKGEKIDTDMVEIKSVEQPTTGGLSDVAQAVNHEAKGDIKEGEVISQESIKSE